MACRLAVIFLGVALLSLLCNALEGGSVAYNGAADLVPVWEPEPTTPSKGVWRPLEPVISGTFRSCGQCRCCSNVGPRNCQSMLCCMEIVCGNEGCTRPTPIYCGCDPKSCVITH